MRRPIPVATAVVALLLFLGAPFLGVEFGQPDDRVLPAEASSREVSQQLRDDFDTQEANAFAVVAPDASVGPFAVIGAVSKPA